MLVIYGGLLSPLSAGTDGHNHQTSDESADTTGRALTDDIYDLLYHAVFIDTSKYHLPERKDFFKSEEYFVPFSGRSISSVRFLQVPTFGGSVYDTTLYPSSDIAKFANSAHSSTRNSIINNNLLFSVNDTISPYQISDTERLLRNLPFLRDARIYVKPFSIDTTEVQLTVVTQDIFPIGIGGSAKSANEFNLDIYDRNMFGMGYEFNNGLRFRSGATPEMGYDGKFYINNLRGSFISGTIQYTNVPENKTIGLSFDKAFLTPQTRYAGGFSFGRTAFYYFPEDEREMLYRQNTTDVWFGRSFQIGGKESRRNITFAFRYTDIRYPYRPSVKPDSNFAFHNQDIILGAMYYSKINYTTSNLIRGFGRTEDIPLGYRFDLTTGYSNTEFENRQYGGIGLSGGLLLDHLGYLSGTVNFGAYYDGGRFENGVGYASLYYFTPLIHLSEYRFRQFFYSDYSIGFNRIDETQIKLENPTGIRWLSDESLTGNQRLSVKFESVLFSPWNLIGFRFALVGFFDTGYIGPNDKIPDLGDMYSSLGFTFRLRNVNLVINTLEIGFAYYTRTPDGVNPVAFHFSTSEPRAFTALQGRKPSVLNFR